MLLKIPTLEVEYQVACSKVSGYTTQHGSWVQVVNIDDHNSGISSFTVMSESNSESRVIVQRDQHTYTV